MALVGTISGSNGTSVTAISGSLIISSLPAASFPSLSNGVKFLVSGTKNSSRTDSPEWIFDIDVFHSGAMGLDQFLQLKPVNALQIPSNTTASYIYTSGSTNDMYFTQYAGAYTNTTRLRWLESAIGTGLLAGGVLSTAAGSTTFSMTAGEGLVVTQNASTSQAPFPTVYHAVWSNVVSRSLDYISTAQITYIGIDGSSQIVQRTTPISLTEDSSIIPIGRILHVSGSVTSAAVMNPTVSYGAFQYLNDFARAVGPLKVSGHVLANSGSNLGITRTAGQSFVLGKNYTLDANNPNVVSAATDTATTTCKVWRQYINNSGNLVIDSGVGGAGYTGIDPNNYVNAGVLTSIPPNKYTIQRVFWFPNSATNAFNVYYGTAYYNSLSAAESAISTESFTEGANTQDAAIFIGYICVKAGATDLSNTSDATILQAGLFRNVAGGGGGGSGATFPGGVDTTVQFNDGGYFNGDSGFKYNKNTQVASVGNLVVTGTNTSTVLSGNLEIKNGAGAVTAAVSNAGNITGSNLLINGDIQMLGGDFTVGANTVRFWDNSSPPVGSDTFFFASGSTVRGSNNIVLGGYTVVSGGVEVKTSAGVQVSYMSSSGVISGSGNLLIGGDITGSNILTTGDIAVNGGDITTTSSTFNIVTGSATTINIGGSAATGTLQGDLAVGGRSTLATVVEKLVTSVGSTGTVTFDLTSQGIFYVNGPTGNISANFTNVPTSNNKVITPTIILSQSSTARSITGVGIDGVSQTILWANKITPTPTANQQDVYGFSLIRSGSIWTVLGQLSTYGA